MRRLAIPIHAIKCVFRQLLRMATQCEHDDRMTAKPVPVLIDIPKNEWAESFLLGKGTFRPATMYVFNVAVPFLECFCVLHSLKHL